MKLEGSIVALITPMTKQGDVDYHSLSRLIEYHVSNGTDAIVSVGTTGESATLNVDEHLAIIEHTIKVANKRIPVIAGTGANSTNEAIQLSREAAKLGADAVLLVVPYYNKPTQEGLFQHYKTIAESVSIPQILYNVPGRTAVDMSNETVARLSHIENIVAIKDATGDLKRGKELISLCEDRLTVLSGDDETALEFMKLGAKGDISVTANVAPKQMSDMCRAALNGDFVAAENINQNLIELHSKLFVESNPIPVKYLMARLGFTANALRLPLTPLASENQKLLDKALNDAQTLNK